MKQPLVHKAHPVRTLVLLFVWFSRLNAFPFSIPKWHIRQKKQPISPFAMAETKDTSQSATTTPRWDPEQQIYVDGIVPENAEVKALIEKNNGYLRLFGYGSLCWNPGTGALSKPGVESSLGRASGYKRCWAQKSTDHRGRPSFPGIVCTLLEDKEVASIYAEAAESSDGFRDDAMPCTTDPTMTEGVIYLIPPHLVDECLEELDFREKGGYARDVITVVEDETRHTHEALLYRGTPDNPAIWPRALLDLPLAAAVMSVSEGPSGKNDFYLNSLNDFLSDTHTIAADNDDTRKLASMASHFKKHSHLYFLFGGGSNQHNQLLLDRPNNSAFLKGEDAHDVKECLLCCKRGTEEDKPTKLFAGGGHSGLLTKAGKLYMWGWNESGQLGSSKLSEKEPMLLATPITDIEVDTAALGFSHTLIVERKTKRVFCFGSNERGQLNGIPSTADLTPSTPSFLADEKVVAVAAGLFHSAVITANGMLITFGCNNFGQTLFASPDTTGALAGRWMPEDGSRVVGVACGRRHTVVVDEKGRIYTFGENKYGQLGRSIEGKFDQKPTLVNGGISPLQEGSKIQIDCGWSHNIVFVETQEGPNHVYGWGRNDKGQLGTGTVENVVTPKEIFMNNDLTMIACGSESTMALDNDGKIWGCGWNEHGNIATGKTEDEYLLHQVTGARVVGPPGLSDCSTTIAAGGAHFLAAKVEAG